MRVLVTGGLGYIGSHTAVELLNKDYEVTIVDNLSNSDIKTKEHIENITNKKFLFFNGDAGDKEFMEGVLKEKEYFGIIHMAAFKSVPESINNPVKYYKNNMDSFITTLSSGIENGVKKFIFSSSATVYGNGKAPFKEEDPHREVLSPYGHCKVLGEDLMRTIGNIKNDVSLISLRYFNPIGSHESGLIGDTLKGNPTNIMPYLLNVALKKTPFLTIYGTDYDTEDKTAVRDFIHVEDVALGHIKALESSIKGFDAINLGTGKGVSVLQLVDAFIKINKVQLPIKYGLRRPKDVAISYAKVDKAKEKLNWEAKKNLEDMVKDSWNFAKNQSCLNL